MVDKKVGRVTRKPAESFVRDGRKFVRFFPVDGGSTECEVFDSKAFEVERGVTFREFCDKLVEVPLDEADHVGKVKS